MNARIVALMFVAVASMSAASAQETSNAAVKQETARAANAYLAAAASGPAEQSPAAPAAPTAVEAGAKKVGTFLGRLVKGPVQAGKALASGVREGFSQPSAAPQDLGGASSSQHGAIQSGPSAMTAPAVSREEMARRITKMFDRVKGTAPAPVEDRSVSASAVSSSSGTTSSSSKSNRISTANEVAMVGNQMF